MNDARIDEVAAAAIIRAQFPELDAQQVRYLGEGCDSVAVDVDGRWVFKFPKREDVEAELMLEIRLLPILAASAPVAIPDFRFTGTPSTDFPFHFGGYALIPGTPAIGFSGDGRPLDQWAPSIAGFLNWLHTHPIDEAESLGAGRLVTAALIDELQADALGDLEAVARVAPDSPIDEWRRHFLAAPRAAAAGAAPHALVHRDFAAEHMLVELATRAMTGVIDWSGIAIADPVIDLAGLYHWGGAPFVDAVLEHYRGPFDRHSLAIARYLGACRGAADVAFGDRMRLPQYIAAGLRSLAANIGD